MKCNSITGFQNQNIIASNMETSENISLAFRSVRSNWLRAILTMMIISFGIMALVGILTAIDSAIFSLSSNLSSLGANTFQIEPLGDGARRHGPRGPRKQGEPFVYRQAMEFKQDYKYPALTSISMFCTGNATIKYGNEKTNPNIMIFGVDENYLSGKGYELEVGRNISASEALRGGYYAVIGQDIVNDLFGGKAEKAVNSTILAGHFKLKVIGVLKERGSAMNEGQDRRVLIPLQTGKQHFGASNKSYNILVAVNDPTSIDEAIGNATMVLRNVRRLRATQQNDFEVTKSDGLINIIKDNTLYFRLAAVGIGLITLLGAAIGLMNIMLVSVTERTREIGISKAIGATRKSITMQFLMEAVVISLMGGLIGIVLGVIIGNVVTYFMGGQFLFPWLWITVALITCTVVGLLSGLYPALKASRLDPIEALRYE